MTHVAMSMDAALTGWRETKQDRPRGDDGVCRAPDRRESAAFRESRSPKSGLRSFAGYAADPVPDASSASRQ